jgi:hypothetical protein
MKRISAAAAVGVLVVAAVIVTSRLRGDDQAAATPKRSLIEVGWDAPTPDFVRANIATMEERPFSGTMINLNAGKTILNKEAYPEDAFEQDRADLAEVSSTTLDHNFITVWSAREDGWDWFSDGDWAAAETNARNFAKTAAAGPTVKGLMIDPEPYGTNPWSYSAELYPNRSFAEVQAKVRERGAAFMGAVQAEKPDITILMLFGATVVFEQAQEVGGLDGASWALFASFVDGMLDVVGPDVTLIDGNEQAYYHTGSSEFDAFKATKQSAREMVSEENRAKYDQQIGVASSVYVDGLLSTTGSPRFFGYYMRDDDERRKLLEHHLFHAVRTTEQYVWVYNEQMNWWGTNGEARQVPDQLEEIVRRVMQRYERGEQLDFDAEPFLSVARRDSNATVKLNGRVTADGKGLAGVTLSSGFMFEGVDTACQVTQEDGYFGCVVPSGWSGRITPTLNGYTFDQPYFAANNVTESTDELLFEASTG